MTEPERKEKKRFRLPERFGGFPVLLLALAGILLLFSGSGNPFSRREKTDAATDPAAYRRALESELAALCAAHSVRITATTVSVPQASRLAMEWACPLRQTQLSPGYIFTIVPSSS